jgi:undecaprenyl-diphosphatase
MELALIIKVIVMGIVEGLTEFVPVSSTAHLLLVGNALNLSSPAFIETLSISIQAGAILAVIWCFWRTIWSSRSMIWKVAIAFIPTAIAGILLYPLLKPLFENQLIIALALIAGGIGLIVIKPIDTDESQRVSSISWRNAFVIGLTQIASFIPGVSRAGATLIGGTLLKIPRSVIVPFSFLLAIPTILGASVVALHDVPNMKTNEWFLILLGALVAFIIALFTIRFFIRLLTTKPLAWFGWYRIAIGILVLLVLV